MTYADVARRLRALGCREIRRRRRGSHRKWINPVNGRRTDVPDWGSKDLKVGTIGSAVWLPAAALNARPAGKSPRQTFYSASGLVSNH